MNYSLNFQNEWGDRELARRGGELGPLETLLRVEFGDEYENAMFGQRREDRPTYDFLVDPTTGNILPNISNGKRDKINLSCSLLPTFVDVVIGASRIRVSLNAYLSRM